jgi:hypothetical protein
LTRVTIWVRVLQDVEQIAPLDVEDDFFNPMPRSVLSFILRVVPVELLHRLSA